ncbi:DUF5990 family protein [Sphingomonas sanxanigenens]|uniref:Uncharacterized protein n=1 Tax=Sphingomonas sanxanigenens DSM 19645 = NX02 TaxID=1123269 RepID=W0A7Q9_9SPHN|nr:DUF5990 family protein [Sphingomonas sanxanigenens]AHE52492.1 hypothetical protein NX02_03690 [Sphingomonas sanxanigenens DSM 19645 = NX02]
MPERSEIRLRIIVEHPVVGVLHSLQAKDDRPLDPKASRNGEPLVFELPIRVGPGPRFFGDQVRREGPVRRFVHIRIGDLAGDPASPWSRRMKIDIHDIDPAWLDRAVDGGSVIETTVNGTGRDGTPACATVRPVVRRLTDR